MYKNTAGQKIAVYAYDTINATAKTGDAPNITAQISLDGGASAATNDANPTELDATDHPGVYVFDLTQAETNANMIVVSAVSASTGIEIDPACIHTQDVDSYKADVTGMSVFDARSDGVDIGSVRGESVDSIADFKADVSAIPTAAQVADAIADELLAAHTTAGSLAKVISTLQTRLAALDATHVQHQTFIVSSDQWVVQCSDDHADSIDYENYAGPDAAGATVHLDIIATADYDAGSGSPVIQKTLGSPVVTEEDDGSTTVTVAVALTAAETATLSPRPPADRFAYTAQVWLECAGGVRQTLGIAAVTAVAAVA